MNQSYILQSGVHYVCTCVYMYVYVGVNVPPSVCARISLSVTHTYDAYVSSPLSHEQTNPLMLHIKACNVVTAV